MAGSQIGCVVTDAETKFICKIIIALKRSAPFQADTPPIETDLAKSSDVEP